MNKQKSQNRSLLFSVPVDTVQEIEIENTLKSLLSAPEPSQVCFLSFRGYLKAKFSYKYWSMLNNAALVIPISRSLVRAAGFLKLGSPVRYMPFEFIIRFLGSLERLEKTLYLVGADGSVLQKSWNNLKDSFPGIRIIGRHVGKFNYVQEQNIITAIQKAEPSCILVGQGVPENEKWASLLKKQLKTGIIIYNRDCYRIFAGKKKKPNKKLWNAGLEHLFSALFFPPKWFLVFPYLVFYIQVLFSRIKNR
ncbi:MAG: WecB/TagA/CpsF family glycosyltransferase [Spirochaetales bacterium]|nr:WecB/TagA/CpsF family glycosyltransferase [Spirochaetales bacterium]